MRLASLITGSILALALAVPASAQVSTSGNTSTITGQYYDKNGKLVTFKSVCTKS